MTVSVKGSHRELATGVQRAKAQEVTGRFAAGHLRRDVEVQSS